MTKTESALSSVPEIGGLEGVTTQWLTAALHACGAVPATVAVGDFHAERSGVGQMSSISRLTLEYTVAAHGAPETVMAKYANADEQARAFGRDAGFYVRETRFYDELVDSLAVRAPDVYYVGSVDEDGNFLLLFEDLMPARVLDQLEGCTVEEAELAVDQIARLHGSSWESSDLATREWLLSGAAMWEMAATQFEPMMALFSANYGPELDDDLAAFGQDFAVVAGNWAARLGARRCLWHGDFRLDNLAFDARSGDVPLAVFDWQTITLGPPAADLAYFLGGAFEPETRRVHEERLVRQYHDGLLGLGVANYTFDECWEDYRVHSVVGFVAAVLGAAKAERSERGDQLLLTMARRHGRHALDLDALAALR